MDCSSITDFQQSTAIRIAKKFRNLHIGKLLDFQTAGWKSTHPCLISNSLLEIQLPVGNPPTR